MKDESVPTLGQPDPAKRRIMLRWVQDITRLKAFRRQVRTEQTGERRGPRR